MTVIHTTTFHFLMNYPLTPLYSICYHHCNAIVHVKYVQVCFCPCTIVSLVTFIWLLASANFCNLTYKSTGQHNLMAQYSLEFHQKHL